MLPKSLEQSRLAFHGPRFDVHTLDLPGQDGKRHRKDVIVHPGAVVILPFIDDHTVALIRNQRVAVGETLLELPAGTLEPPESPDVCAGRELIEETGYRADSVVRMLDFYTSPGICTERMYAYVARGLTHVGQDLDLNEQITVEATPLEKTIQMVRDNVIRDGKSIATLMFYMAFIAGR
ncbi:MAG: NUDIX hydrolase [Planctomycetes bacterium]|nr:NUDIX hydrolase [Planctomycetota bacterium]